MEFVINGPEDVDVEKEKIIKYEKVKGIVDDSLSTYNEAYLKQVTELIETEQSVGLDPYALSICGDSPAYKQGQKVQNKITELGPSIENVKAKIHSATLKQRAKELKQLVTAIDECITKTEGELATAQNNQQNLEQQWANYDKASREYPQSTNPLVRSSVIVTPPLLKRGFYQSQIDRLNKKIEDLKTKREEVNSEASAVAQSDI